MIPKKIHYCWFGNKPKSKLIKRCIKSWEEKCPDYEIIEWNESNFDVFHNKYVKEAFENKKWAFVSDYARLWIIYNYGGIYLDTDVELIKNLDDILDNNTFFSFEGDNINTGLGFGASQHNGIIKSILDDYEDKNFIIDGKLDLTPCTIRNTSVLKEIFKEFDVLNKNKKNNVDGNLFLSATYFSPYDPLTGIMNIEENTIGIHWYNASWRKKSINVRRMILKPIRRMLGKERIEKIKECFKWGK